MSDSLVHFTPGRPLFVEYRDHFGEAGIVWITIHDQYYLEKKREFLERVKALHPDKNWRVRNGWKVGMVIKSYQYWRHTQDKWYAQFGLMRPDRKLPIKEGNDGSQEPLFVHRKGRIGIEAS